MPGGGTNALGRRLKENQKRDLGAVAALDILCIILFIFVRIFRSILIFFSPKTRFIIPSSSSLWKSFTRLLSCFVCFFSFFSFFVGGRRLISIKTRIPDLALATYDKYAAFETRRGGGCPLFSPALPCPSERTNREGERQVWMN